MANKKATLPPDPEKMNLARSHAAAYALRHFAKSPWGETIDGKLTPDLVQQNLVDLLGDLAHFCDRNDLSLADCLRRAWGHYDTETDGEPRQQFYVH